MGQASTTAQPHLACEITPEAVIAASARGGALESCRRALSPGSVAPSLVSGNVTDTTDLERAVSEALGSVANRKRDVILIVPDSAVRVVLLDFDSLPTKRQEADQMVRFRLRKSLPFDVDEAAVSYDARVLNGSTHVVAAVTLRSVLDEYESSLRRAGYSPGVVVPSMFAALGLVRASEPTLVLKADGNTTSLAIVDANQLLLFRTLESPPGVLDSEQMASNAYPSLVYFEDHYSLQVRKILVAGLASAAEVGPALQAQSGAEVSDLGADAPETVSGEVPPMQLVGVRGALS